jgi:hypothetical protein
MATKPLFQVALTRVPGTTSVVNFTEPTTVADIITADGGNPAEWKAQIAGQDVEMTAQVTEHTGTIRLLKSKVKGNATKPLFQVALTRVPGTTSVVNFTEPTTVADIITADGGNPAEWKAQIAGADVEMSAPVTEHTGTIRLLKSKVKGN